MTYARRAARGTFVTLGGQWSKFVVQMVGTAVLARILTPDDFGSVAMVMAIIGIATLFADFGLGLASLRTPDMSHQDKSNLFWINLAVGLFASVVVFVVAEPIAKLYERPDLGAIVQALSCVFVLQAACGQLRAELARRLKFQHIVLADVSAQLTATGLAVLLAYIGWGVWSLVLQQIVFAILLFVGMACTAKWVPRAPQKLGHSIKFLTFGAKAGTHQIINYLSANFDSVLIGRYWGAESLGVYNQSFIFYKMPIQQIASPLTQVIVPILSRVDKNSFLNYVAKIQNALVYGIGGIFVLLASVADPLLILILGDQWSGVAEIFSVLALGGIFQTLGYVYYWIFIVKDLTGRQLLVGGSSRVLMLFAMWLAIPLGPVAIAWTVTAGLFVNWLLLTILVLPAANLRRRDFLARAKRPIIIFGVGYLLSLGLTEYLHSTVTDIVQVALVVLAWMVFLIIVALAWPGFRNDILGIFSIFRLLAPRNPGRMKE